MEENRRYFSEIMNMNAVPDMDTEEDDEEKLNIYKEPMRRNLLDVFDKSEPLAEVTDERMNVFLRVRPFSIQELEAEEDQGCVEVVNEYMVSANAPKDSHTYKSTTYGLGKAKHNFTFSRVFPEDTSQKQFFDATMLKLVQDFIEGQNCLVFTYGVTNSGKTYTIQGNPREAGVLPRGLDVLFNSINGRQWPAMNLKPRLFNDVVKLSPEEEELERKLKERTLKLNSSEDHDVMTLLGEDASDQSNMNTTSQSDSSTAERKGSLESEDVLQDEVENRVREEAAVDVTIQGQIRFSVWVSFAEIYNEQIFDLLEPLPKKKNARRTILKLSEDRRGSPYIKGLKEINVTSADEAYKLLTIGQRNLKTACTNLNHCSSRSHCIFNIKIIRVSDKGDPKIARVSMLSLCDLAGSERHSKTHTTGERLKEASSINTSLHTLGRCIEMLRQNQLQKKENKNSKIIPFRDSRLTRLFQNFFCGRGKAAMIVNVSQSASMFDETLNVFKFSAIAKQVVMPPKPVEKPAEPQPKRKRTTKGVSRASSICWDPSATPSSRVVQEPVHEEEDIEEDEEDDDTALYIEYLEQKVLGLEKNMRQMKRDGRTREMEIRQEVCREMQEQFIKIEDHYSNMLKETRQQGEERLEKKLQLVMEAMEPLPTKRRRVEADACDSAAKAKPQVMVDDDDEWVSSLLLYQEKVKVQERDTSLAEAKEGLQKLQTQVTELQFQVADLTRKNKGLHEKVQAAEDKQRQMEQDCDVKVAEASKCESDGDLGQTVLLETLGQQLQEAKDRLRQQEKEMADLNEMLTDAGDTFHQKEEEIRKLKAVIAEDEEKTLQQVETIRELRQLLEESKRTVEETEKRMEAKNQSISVMKGTCSACGLASKNNSQPQHLWPVVAVTPLRKGAGDVVTVARLTVHKNVDFDHSHSVVIVPGTPSPAKSPRLASEVESRLCSPTVICDSCPSTTPSTPVYSCRPKSQHLPSVAPHSPALDSLRCLTGKKHASPAPKSPGFIATKTECNRVLRVMVTPLQKLMSRHTKTSLMRLKLTPNKSTTSTPGETPPGSPANKTKNVKRKLEEIETPRAPTPEKVAKPAKKTSRWRRSGLNKSKNKSAAAKEGKYNLRSRR